MAACNETRVEARIEGGDKLQITESAAKRIKLDTAEAPSQANSGQNGKNSSHDEVTKVPSIHLQDKIQLQQIEFVRVLNVISSRKIIYIEGKYNGERLVLVLEKLPIDEASARAILECTDQSLQRDFFNDIYGNYLAFPPQNVNGIKTIIIHPATEKHIEKYKPMPMHLLDESAQDYEQITLPYIERSQFSIDWVYNILEHRLEQDRILLEDADPETGFVLLPDLKWNGKQVDNLYLIAICHKHGIKSLRDLGPEHLPLLQNIQRQCTDLIHTKYGLVEQQLRIYLHYQPSYYHLHVHFNNLGFDAPAIQIGRSHLLSSVISNLEFFPDYYKKATLTFVVRDCDPLYKEFKQQKALPDAELTTASTTAAATTSSTFQISNSNVEEEN